VLHYFYLFNNLNTRVENKESEIIFSVSLKNI